MARFDVQAVETSQLAGRPVEQLYQSRIRSVSRPRLLRTGAVAGIVLAVPIALAAPVGSALVIRQGAMEAEYAMGIDGPNGLVVANRHGVFRTRDGGKRWSDITPKDLDGFYEHISETIATGGHIWLELEGSSVFDFLLYSFSGGRTWRAADFPGFPSGLGFVNPDDGWVTVTSSSSKRMLYRSTDGGLSWQRSPRVSKLTAPASLAGVTISRRGAVPAGLRIRHAIQFPGNLAWAQAWGPSQATFTPTYLLRSQNGGQTWALVSGP